MSGAAAVVALVLLEWVAGWMGAAAWTQSWAVVKRGHFRILAWGAILLGVAALLASREAASGLDAGWARGLTVALAASACVYLLAQYVRTDMPGTVVGIAGAVIGAAALVANGSLIDGWGPTGPLQLISGAALLGAVTNGMLLGHWYLNQPGLKPWALARLTSLSLVAVIASAAAGLLAAGALSGARVEGAALGLTTPGDSFGMALFLVWVALVALTGVVVFMAMRCVKIRSIQSATGLYYIAILTAGVSEFLVRYLMVNAA
jgi:uncharacterized membrane protein